MNAEQVAKIKELYAEGFWPEEIAEDFPDFPLAVLAALEPEASKNLTNTQLREINRRGWAGEDPHVLAAEYGVSYSLCEAVRRGASHHRVTRQWPVYLSENQLLERSKRNGAQISEETRQAGLRSKAEVEARGEEYTDPIYATRHRSNTANPYEVKVVLEPTTFEAVKRRAFQNGLSVANEIARHCNWAYYS